jgi:hypothetical protein
MRFTQVGALGPGDEDSPEGENAMSRIYLGVHWLFDQEDGVTLGNAIAEYASQYFYAVPEPSALALVVLGALGIASTRRR